MTTTRRALGALVVLAALAACGDSQDDDSTEAGASTTATTAAEPVIDPGDGGDYQPNVDPAAFVDEITNPYLPFQPGARWVYDGEDDGEQEHVEVTVTDDRREVMGINAVVVRDTVTVDGEVIEDTYDWYAQDRDGNVWYLGEDSTSYEEDPPSKEGSWEAGVDGALPGIVMLADPQVGDAYRQEYLVDEAEDMGQVLARGEQAEVPAGSYEDVLLTEDWTPLEPEVVEEKEYAPGVGLIRETKTAGGEGLIELVEYTPPS
jgi:hypothetical protein